MSAGWARARRLILAAAGLVALVLGTWGFSQVERGEPGRTALTDLYEALGLFALQGGNVDGHVPWALEVARFLSPLVVAGAAISAFLALSRQEGDRVRARRASGHLVVVGAGPRAVALALDAEERGGRTGRRRPVVVEVTGDEAAGAAARAAGLVVVEAGAVESEAEARRALLRAGAGRAEVVISLTGSLAVDARAAAAVVGLHDDGLLPDGACSFVEIDDLEVARHLQTQPEDRHRRAGQEFFNTAERAAGALVADLPGASDGGAEHVLLVGDGDLAACVGVQLARSWSADGAERGASPVLTLASPTSPDRARGLQERLHRWYPRFPVPGASAARRDACRAHAVGPGPDGIPAPPVGTPPPTVAVVAVDDDGAGAHVALGLLTDLPEDVPVVLCSAGDASIGDLVSSAAGDRLRVAAVQDLVLREEAIRAGSVEAMAHTTHERYRRLGHDAPPWTQLGPAAREDNRRPVRELWRELAAHGYRVVAHRDVDAEEDRIADDPRRVDGGESVRDALARAEHERWFRQRTDEGYVWGPEPGPTTKPCLKPWDDPDLPDPCRAATYQQVDDIPRTLAAAGLQLDPRPHLHRADRGAAGGAAPGGAVATGDEAAPLNPGR